MNGVHDMGGMHGYGPVDISDDVLFHADWEKRVFGMTLATLAHLQSNIDHQRYRLELLAPNDYLTTYFDRWFLSLLRASAAAGLIPQEAATDIENNQLNNLPAAPVAVESSALNADFMRGLAAAGISSHRAISADPTFKVGDKVHARNINPPTHTRMPRYVRGKTGTVIAHRGAHVWPDSNAQFKGEDPRHLYSVSFTAQELWGADAAAGDTVVVDLWEPYLDTGS